MINIPLKQPPAQEKRTSLKNYSHIVVRKLKALNLLDQFSPDYVSENGSTIFDFMDLIKKLDKCSGTNHYLYSDVLTPDGSIKESYKPVSSCSCHIYSLCPSCASIRRNELIKQIKPFIEFSHYLPVHLYNGTITIKDTAAPARDYEHLRRSWTRFIKRGQLRDRITGKRSGGEAGKIIGAVLSIEIVPTSPGMYHVHGHVLLVCSDPLEYMIYDPEKRRELEKQYGKGKIPEKEMDRIIMKKILIPDVNDCFKIEKEVAVSALSEEWYKSSGALNFWLKPLRERYIKGKLKTVENQLYEIIKYTTKTWELSAIDMLKLWDNIKGKKRLTRSGIFTNSKTHIKIWRDLLDGAGLLEQFEKRLKEVNVEISYSDDKVLNQVFNYDTFEYDLQEEEADYSYLNTPEYQQFLKDRAILINQYRVTINNMVRQLKKKRKSGEPTTEWKLAWINEKIFNKKQMRIKLHELIRQFQYTINGNGGTLPDILPDNPEL